MLQYIQNHLLQGIPALLARVKMELNLTGYLHWNPMEMSTISLSMNYMKKIKQLTLQVALRSSI